MHPDGFAHQARSDHVDDDLLEDEEGDEYDPKAAGTGDGSNHQRHDQREKWSNERQEHEGTGKNG